MTTTINMTIHNKGFLLNQVLNRLFTYTTIDCEFVFVLDGCTDNSGEILKYFCNLYKNYKTKILYANNIFETKSNNLAFKQSSGDYIIVVQDDTLLNEKDWNKRILKPFAEFNDVFGVTGRTAHNWSINKNSIDISNNQIYSDRWCDILYCSDHADMINTDRNTFAIRDTVNRSPLALNHSDLQKLNYLDETFAPLDSDDHDLMFRMTKELKKVCGFYSIDWFTKPEYGGTRNEKGETRPFMFEANHKNTRILYERHKDIINNHKVENRKLI